jgi:hypothetical protein
MKGMFRGSLLSDLINAHVVWGRRCDCDPFYAELGRQLCDSDSGRTSVGEGGFAKSG